MNAKPSKSRPKVSVRRKRAKRSDLAELLMPYARGLPLSPYVRKDVGRLTSALLATTARHTPTLSEQDTLIGVTGAALLAAYAFNQDPAELCAWLRGTADSLERSRPK